MAASIATSHLMAADPDIASEGGASDPFSAPGGSNHHRYSHFDTQLFALGPATSPEQAKRALEAHLAETERRIQDASKLGTTLVQQRKSLSERLKEVEKQQNDGDITPELRQKLVDIEKEYNEVGRESARAFLPKSRVSSSEMGGSPFIEAKRSVSPSKFESQATNSPSKLNVPNRKQRNQPANRVHDIEFATEISTSLLSQVRHLQSLLADKEEALRSVTIEKSKLESDAEGFHQRLRSLDESEHRYKDENWNLETQIHEHISTAKEAADREKKLTQTLNIVQTEKSSAQKELDEIKLSHAKLVEDHAAIIKHHDVELGGVKRNMTMVENERGALQRKIDDLTGQNHELAMAVAHQRGRIDEQEHARGLSDEDFETANDNITPEHSPPPSPIKGTPRHSMLESETLKSSLHHAHRMIQSLKGNIHREKTEKLELKRMLQDARDELESRRGDGIMGSGAGKRSRKVDSKEFKKPLKPGQLGGLRSSRSEISMDEANWEDHNGEASPSRSSSVIATRLASGAAAGAAAGLAVNESSDQFETANEQSDAFETANERATETEDFHTGHEDMSGSDELTETEMGPSGTVRGKKPPPLSLTKPGNRGSFQSTASLSGDEYSYEDIRTPVQNQPQRLRLRMSRGSSRRSRVGSEDPQFASSPASILNSSNNGTPQPNGQTLFAELGDLNSDEDESVEGTPMRQSILLTTEILPSASRPTTAKSNIGSPPPNMPPVSKPAVVDSGMMTELWEPTSPTAPHLSVPYVAGAGLAGAALSLSDKRYSSVSTRATMSDAASQWHEEQFDSLLSPSARDSRPISTSTYSDMSSQYEPDIDEKLASFPSPPRSRSHTPMVSLSTLDVTAPLTISTIVAAHVEPSTPKPGPKQVPLEFSSINSVDTEPVEPTTPLQSPRQLGVLAPTSDGSFKDNVSPSPEIKLEDPETPKPFFFTSVPGWNKKTPVTPIIAEDETCGSPSDSPLFETPESQRPFKEISANAIDRATKKPRVAVCDEGSQTALTAEQIDSMLKVDRRKLAATGAIQPPAITSPPRGTIIPPALRVRKSNESVGSVSRARAKMVDPDFVHDTVSLKRPGSAGSARRGSLSSIHPPLPSNHQQTIAAAAQRSGSSGGGLGAMGPPLWPASANRPNPSFRPRTPSSQLPGSPPQGGTTPRAIHSSGIADVFGPVEVSTSTRSRHSSISSFVSEVDNRFNTKNGGSLGMPQGLSHNTDPRMIQAITQTMIGEYLWKYTRKAGRGEMSENRHRRYFWVHPYTRTLYWSDRDPATAGKMELKAKSVAIEAVRVVTDDNPMPPGLHRKSLIVLTPGRAVKFTATTGQRHETWFNALSYLLLRTDGTLNDTEDVASGALTREDVDEFNPSYGSRSIRGQGPPSLSSYNSRTTRNESPAPQTVRASINHPTLTQNTSSRPSVGTFSRLSNYWKPGGSFSSRRSRHGAGSHGSMYEASEVHDSAEDLREMIEKQDRESDKLENVRACCDGKHDVGSLSHIHNSKRGRHTPVQNTPSSSQRNGAHSRQSIPEATE